VEVALPIFAIAPELLAAPVKKHRAM